MKSDEEIEYERAALGPLIGPTRAGWYAEACMVGYSDHSEAALWKCRFREMAMAAGQLAGERNAYAQEALVALAGAVGTPEKGYILDGGHGLMGSDIRRLRKQRDELLAAVRNTMASLSQTPRDRVPPPIVVWDIVDRLHELNQRLNLP